jgi:arylformamidase
MIPARLSYKNHEFEIDLEQPIDISIPVGRTTGPNAFYLQPAEYSTVEAGNFIGDVTRGGSCNVENIFFSPHGNGTHTECSGHIDPKHGFVNTILKRHFYLAGLITVSPEDSANGKEISRSSIEKAWNAELPVEAIIIRTLPNTDEKKSTEYSGTNPPYFSADAIRFLNQKNILHLLTDLPSLDKEDDNRLTAHHLFFNHQTGNSEPKTVTEMIFAGNDIKDGLYWLDLQVAGFESDASPGKPILYKTRLIK